MPETDDNQHNVGIKPVNEEKSADILQGTFTHYYNMAKDHHTKAGTTSSYLLVIVGAIVTLVGFDGNVCGGFDLGCAIGLIVLGLFGMVWAWKQHERYFYWSHIARNYQKELTEIVPMLRPEEAYEDEVQKLSASKFGSFFSKKIDRYLWVFLHFIVVAIGVWLILAN